MNMNAFFVPGPEIQGEKVRLRKPICAIQLAKDDGGRGKLGLVSQLRTGTVIERCGLGFNERTAKVRVDGDCYFVFVQDLDSQLCA